MQKYLLKYVLDAVEAVNNESKMNAKRVPGVLDAGITWGRSYLLRFRYARNVHRRRKVILLFAKNRYIYISGYKQQ